MASTKARDITSSNLSPIIEINKFNITITTKKQKNVSKAIPRGGLIVVERSTRLGTWPKIYKYTDNKVLSNASYPSTRDFSN